MRHLVRTEIGLVATFVAAMLAAYIGLAVSVSGADRPVGWLVLVTALWAMIYAPVLHDREHRYRGEETHAVWGHHDRRKPHWWSYW